MELSTRLCDPFSPAQPELLQATLHVLQTTLLNCWPRISQSIYYVEIIRALSLCWTNIKDEENDNNVMNLSSKFTEIKEQVRVNARILIECLKGKVNFEMVLAPVFNAEPGLREVFAVTVEAEL